MMDWHLGPAALREALTAVPLPAWRFYPEVDSTNDAARRWAAEGAPEGCLVLAERQTRGRGREGRRWWSAPGASLTFTLVARPLPPEQAVLARFTAWGAVALAEMLREDYGLPAAVKWPNDVLLRGRKVAGVLAEAVWEGARPQAVVVGIGINLAPEALSGANPDFPPTTVAAVLGAPPPRWDFLARLLRRMGHWRYRLASAAFVHAWEDLLAYRGQAVRVGAVEGVLLGLDAEGGLRVRLSDGRVHVQRALRGHLRPSRGVGA